jgi:hypothetical protein
VVTVVSVSFHHQQCDHFCKIQQENAKWTGAIIYMWHLNVVLPTGAPVKVCTTGLCGQKGQRATSISNWMLFGPVDLGPL